MRVAARRKVGRKAVGDMVDVEGEALLARSPVSRSDAGVSWTSRRSWVHMGFLFIVWLICPLFISPTSSKHFAAWQLALELLGPFIARCKAEGADH